MKESHGMVGVTNIDQMIEARWLATVDGEDRVLENQAVAIDQGKIVGIGAREELCQIFKPSSKVSFSDHLLIPGFVNAHNPWSNDTPERIC